MHLKNPNTISFLPLYLYWQTENEKTGKNWGGIKAIV